MGDFSKYLSIFSAFIFGQLTILSGFSELAWYITIPISVSALVLLYFLSDFSNGKSTLLGGEKE